MIEGSVPTPPCGTVMHVVVGVVVVEDEIDVPLVGQVTTIV